MPMVRSFKRGETHFFDHADGRTLVKIEIVANRPGSRQPRMRITFDRDIKLRVVPPPELPTVSLVREPSMLERASTAPRPGPPILRRPSTKPGASRGE